MDRALPPLEPSLLERAQEEPSARQARLDRARQNFLRACRWVTLELGQDEAERLFRGSLPQRGRPRGPQDWALDQALLAEYDSIVASASSEADRAAAIRTVATLHASPTRSRAAVDKHLRRLLGRRKDTEDFYGRMMDAAPEGATLVEAVCLWYHSTDKK